DAGATPQEIILDPEGTIGRLYGAKTTPHMFIITPDGDIAYRGAIDSKRSTNVDDIATAENYVASALTDLENGVPVRTAATKPYGCSVKY
ncbi:MAG: thioredoxin family protein, partial [Pseudomonadota bacterium]